MTLTLQALENAFSSIESVGKGELPFTIAGTSMVVRIVPPDEEAEVHKQASAALSGGDEEVKGQHQVMVYLSEIKLGILSHAIVEIDGTDLRDSPYIETGEELPNKKKVKISRAEAIRKVIRQRAWSGTLIAMVFRKYGELVEDVERKAEGTIDFEPSDRPAEIERLKKRLEHLETLEKEEKEKGEETLGSALSSQVKSIVAMDKQDAKEKEENLAQLAAGIPRPPVPAPGEETGDLPEMPDEEPMSPESPAPAARQPIIPRRAAPPAPTGTAPMPPPQPQQTPQRAPEQVEDNSFIDPNDPEAMRAAVDAENDRLMRARMGIQESQPPQPESVLTAAHAQRRPPHLDAAETARGYLGDHDGVAPVRAPAEELSRGAAPGKAAPMTLNTQAKGAVNPRFKAPGNRG